MALPPQVYGQYPANVTYVPVESALAVNNYDLAALAECQLGTGRAGAPPGTTNFGFSDTTYLPTTAQILRQTTTGQY
jgi:hypothetical protein